MSAASSLERIGANLSALGARKLVALAVVGLTISVGVAAGGYLLSRPTLQTLYTGLSAKDVSRIRIELAEAGIPFDVDSKGTAVLVPPAKIAAVRMLLAEKGLPSSSTSGYELFDSLGSMGLTSFMQEVTRKRALEGEIARTIQSMKGIRAARVHIVLPERGSFRRKQRKTSASVVIRTEGDSNTGLTQAIRHLVSSAVPGLASGYVSVLNTDGVVLAAGGESSSTAPQHKMSLEQSVANSLSEKVRNTLTPFLGGDNFRVSIAVKLNTDRRRTNETKFDPESRVERSVRVLKSLNSSQNKQGNEPATVEQNVPETEAPEEGKGNQSKERGERREELTNYELSSKTTSTESVGYVIDRLTVATVVNRRKLAELAGGQNGTPGDIQKQLKEIERIAAMAAGLSDGRGDKIVVSAVDFVADPSKLEPVPAPGILDTLMRHVGTFINALAALVAIFLLLQYGLRPLTKTLLDEPKALTADEAEAGDIALEAEPVSAVDAANPNVAAIGTDELGQPVQVASADLIEDDHDPATAEGPAWRNRLEELLADEDKAVAVVRDWIHEDARP